MNRDQIYISTIKEETKNNDEPDQMLCPPREKNQQYLDHFSIFACHLWAGAMLIFSVSFQFYMMSPKRQLRGLTLQYIKKKLALASVSAGLATEDTC